MLASPTEQRFRLSFDKQKNGCWIWNKSTNQCGYGHLRVSRGPIVAAHRLSWELHFGKIPKGLCVCHKCDVPACVNPKHLFLGSRVDNAQDSVRKGRNRPPPIRRGEKNHSAKLNKKVIREIRAIYSAGGISQAALGKQFGVAQSVIGNIVRLELWKCA